MTSTIWLRGTLRSGMAMESVFQFSECYIIVSIGGLEKLPPFAYIKTK